MTAEQPSVEALVERVRAAAVESGPIYSTDSFNAALDSLTSRLERAERERDALFAAVGASMDDAKLLAAEARAQKAEAANARLLESHNELADALVKAEAALWEITRKTNEAVARAQKAEAVVEAARLRADYADGHHWRCEYRTAEKGWKKGEPPIIECICGLEALDAALTAYDEPAETGSIDGEEVGWRRAPVDEPPTEQA